MYGTTIFVLLTGNLNRIPLCVKMHWLELLILKYSDVTAF